MRYYLAILATLLSTATFAKPNETINFDLKWHPVNIVSPLRPSLQFSVECIIAKKVGLEFGLGRRYRSDKYEPSTIKPYGRNLLGEINYYKVFIRAKREKRHWTTQDFIGVSYRNVLDRRNVELNYSTDGFLPTNYKEYCAVRTLINAYGMRYGFKLTRNRISFQAFGEIGSKHEQRTYIANEAEALGYMVYEPGFRVKPVNEVVPFLNVGLKVSFTFF